MKTISQIVKMLDAGLIKPEEIYEIKEALCSIFNESKN